MAKYKFEVHYVGEAVENSSIPINDLAPSLLSLSEAFQTIQKINNPDGERLSLNISATKKGSFIAELFLVNGPDLIKKAMNLLNGNDSQAFLNLTQYAGIFITAVDTIKRIADKKIASKKEEEGQVKLKLDDETSLTIPEAVFKTYGNVEFRKQIHDVMKPLDKSGISGIDFSHDEKIKVSVGEKEYHNFEVPPTKEKELTDEVSEVYLQIINVAFEHGKWKFSNGASQFFADIEDQDFLDAVTKNEQRFGSTDTLKVKMKTSQYLDTDGKLKSNYTILKVLDHIKGSEEIELDLFDSNKKDN
ncbi:hypothetical protein [Lactobacillus sp. ESL0681]|uniref:hypothetical protein n=1 Tax=Lactobacillus sp. ESL0681 TaxID=2983211 RepID=UPI0023F6E38F|nr:hypothetical protein [Lactobacillus sp. ESL0681]WEV40345.1 hypothetical protein OZX59_00055 [Lactobacillus sp. ESL0681]